jgi:hypothetical protein
MIPIKDKKYMLNCQGPYDYNRYMGEGVYTGDTDNFDIGAIAYGFKIPTTKETCFFLEEEIAAMIFAEQTIAETPEQIQDQIDSENNYCEKCDSCGETGCCPPINCEAVKCKYGDINVKDYRCFQDQWSVMYEALKDIKNANSYFLVQEIAKNALNEVDKLWDKLYSKEQA